MHRAQQPRFTPFVTTTNWLLLDSIRAQRDHREMYFTLAGAGVGRDGAIVVTDALGHVRRLSVTMAPLQAPDVLTPTDAARWERMRRVTSGGYLRLLQTQLWDVTAFVPASLRAGMRWTDTLARSADDGAYGQQVSGRRTFTVSRDSINAGRRLWIVHDSAAVRYEERYVEQERTLDTLVSVTRQGAGALRGTFVYDADHRMVIARHDTLIVDGEAVLGYPDGRSFSTPARLERFHSWTLHDSAQYVARRNALRNQSARKTGGIVHVPSPDDQRLVSGDTVLRDSLIRAWKSTADPDEGTRIFQRLSMWSRGAMRATLDSIRIAAGDSVFLYRTLASRAFRGYAGVDSADIGAMLPFLEDPGRAWMLNVSRDHLYENLVQGLMNAPRAAAQAPGEMVSCTESACALLGSQVSARESRLRDVALAALFSVDPARWADTIIQLAGREHSLLREPASVARGVGASWPAASKKPIPPPGSDWRAWLEWMNGRDSAAFIRDAQLAQRYDWARDTTTRPRFDGSHRVALRMYARRTRRDVIGELQHAYRSAATEQARLVFGMMLSGLGALDFTDEEIADAFSSGDPTRATLAREIFLRRFHEAAKPMDSVRASPLVDRMLAVLLDNAPLWAMGARDLYANKPPSRPEMHARRGRVLVSTSHIPSELRKKWAGKAEFINANRPKDSREAAVVYSVEPVLGMGRFARVTVNAAEQLARPADAAPEHYASGVVYYLMRVGDEWVIVATMAWVT